jgi:enterochelin esterase-like enzyme
VLGRIGALLGMNLLVLATVGLVANDVFGFFADWTDLTGSFASTPPPARTTQGGESAQVAAGARVLGGGPLRAPRFLPPLPKGDPGGREYTFTVSGPVSHVTGQVVVRLPAGYADPKQARRRYPVIETFHGYPGRPSQWLEGMALGPVLDEQAAIRRMSPTIVLAPQLEIPPGRDTECVDGVGGRDAMETWLTTDVPDWAARTLRVRLDRASWATAGLSAGGWCAAMSALLHPARYGATMIFGGYFRPYFGSGYVPFPAASPQARRYDLVALVKRDPPPVAIWMETSHSDKISYTSSTAFLQAVRPPLSVRLLEFPHAGHSILLWAPLVPQAVQWLETIGGFRAGP